MHSTLARCCISAFLTLSLASLGAAQDVQSLVARIKAVGKEGVGNVDAAKAWKELVAKGPEVLPDVLAGMDDASPVAVNWLRGAVEAVQDKAIAKGQKLPAQRIEAFLNDTRHAGHSRRLAYETLVRLDPTTPDRLLPKMLDDPSSELRRDAVEVKIKNGGSLNDVKARTAYFQDLLKHARDRDQVKVVADELKKLDFDVDLTRHYGFITAWQLIGPFDNVKGVGFNNVYPPEKGIDLKTTYEGKAAKPVRWQPFAAAKIVEFKELEELGVVDLNQAFGKLKGAVAFGHAAVVSETERPVELRAGSNNAVRIWLNGKEVYFREEYHHGMKMDQHVGKGTLKVGRNEILIKVCQNEQTDYWAQLWSFQLRVCDALGGAVPINVVTEKGK